MSELYVFGRCTNPDESDCGRDCEGCEFLVGGVLMGEEYIGWLDDEWNVVLDQNQPIVRCKDCRFIDTKQCPIKRALLYDGLSESACVAPGGYCAWGERRDA